MAIVSFHTRTAAAEATDVSAFSTPSEAARVAFVENRRGGSFRRVN
jgi:hypothetical protein